MKPVSTKLAILETITEMDHVQAEKVLDYIKSVLSRSPKDDYANFKERALKEIQNALNAGTEMLA